MAFASIGELNKRGMIEGLKHKFAFKGKGKSKEKACGLNFLETTGQSQYNRTREMTKGLPAGRPKWASYGLFSRLP